MPRPFGVEEEFLVVDGRTAAAAATGDRIIDAAAGFGAQVEQEFAQQQVEIDSAPAENAADLLDDLRGRRAAAITAAEQVGSRLAALGTHPLPVESLPTITDRFDRITEHFGVMTRDQLTCGQHVHVEVESRAVGVDVLNRIAPWLSVITALSANSPFWQGSDSGFASFRTVRWAMWPTVGPVHGLSGLSAYDELVADLVESEAALDEGMIYFDARLSAKYPTVEIRVADVSADVADAVLVAVLCRALVDTAIRDARRGEPVPQLRPELLRAAGFHAARSGPTGTLVDLPTRRSRPAREVIEAFLNHIHDAVQASGEGDLVSRGLKKVLTDGGGAARQRVVHRRRGLLADVVEDAVLRTRI